MTDIVYITNMTTEQDNACRTRFVMIIDINFQNQRVIGCVVMFSQLSACGKEIVLPQNVWAQQKFGKDSIFLSQSSKPHCSNYKEQNRHSSAVSLASTASKLGWRKKAARWDLPSIEHYFWEHAFLILSSLVDLKT